MVGIAFLATAKVEVVPFLPDGVRVGDGGKCGGRLMGEFLEVVERFA